MSEEDINECHPFRMLDEQGGLPETGIGLLIARSGVGKSAALINFALDLLLQGKQVLHFTVGMPSDKTHQYYKRIYSEYTRNYPITKRKSWDEIYHNFVVISYLDSNVMIKDLEREIGTIVSSAKLTPSLILVDGLDIDESTATNLDQMRSAAKTNHIPLLASMRIHRANNGHVDLDSPLKAAEHHTDRIFFLEPQNNRINLEVLSSAGSKALPVYFCPHDFIFRPT